MRTNDGKLCILDHGMVSVCVTNIQDVKDFHILYLYFIPFMHLFGCIVL